MTVRQLESEQGRKYLTDIQRLVDRELTFPPTLAARRLQIIVDVELELYRSRTQSPHGVALRLRTRAALSQSVSRPAQERSGLSVPSIFVELARL